MALLFMDGCEHYITADLAEKYTYVSSQAVSNTRARTGTYSISGGVHGIAVAASGATAIVGYGVYATAGGHYCTVGLGGFASATYAHVSMRVETDGSVTVRNGISSSATKAATAAHLAMLAGTSIPPDFAPSGSMSDLAVVQLTPVCRQP